MYYNKKNLKLKEQDMYKLYGIPNCNTVKKAKDHLEQSGLEFELVNFKKAAPTQKLIKEWKDAFGDWPVNKRGPTFRKIKEDFENANAKEKTTLLIENSSAIKRPILVLDGEVLAFGYDEEKYNQI